MIKDPYILDNSKIQKSRFTYKYLIYDVIKDLVYFEKNKNTNLYTG